MTLEQRPPTLPAVGRPSRSPGFAHRVPSTGVTKRVVPLSGFSSSAGNRATTRVAPTSSLRRTAHLPGRLDRADEYFPARPNEFPTRRAGNLVQRTEIAARINVGTRRTGPQMGKFPAKFAA